MPFILDTSVALVWHLEDETSEYSERILERLNTEDALVPGIWPLEVANALLVAERRGRLRKEKIDRAIELMLTLPITIHEVSIDLAFTAVSEIARSQALSIYDATYLELALREGLPLATLDNGLRQAAQRAGVSLIE